MNANSYEVSSSVISTALSHKGLKWHHRGLNLLWLLHITLTRYNQMWYNQTTLLDIALGQMDGG